MTSIRDIALTHAKTPEELDRQADLERMNKFQSGLDAMRTILGIQGIGASDKTKMLLALAPLFAGCDLSDGNTDDYKAIEHVLRDGGAYEHGANFPTHEIMQEYGLTLPALKFQPHSMSALLAMPPKEWIIDQVLGKGDIGMIYGAPGCGKTFVVIDLIFAACLGNQWAMRFDIERRLNVAYCAGEGISGLPSRFAAASEHHGVDDVENFTFYAQTPQLYVDEDSPPVVGTINQFVSEWGQRLAEKRAQPLDILIIDTLHSATSGADENSAGEMGKVLAAAKQAANDLGCAVVLVHHTNKNGTAERGSSALRGAMDCMIEIKRISDTGTKAVMHCAKLKDGEAWKDQTLDLVESVESVRVWWDEPSETSGGNRKQNSDVDAIISLLRSGQRYTATSIAEAIGMGGSKQIFKLIPLAMKTEAGVKAGLKNPNKDSSPHNPMVYWFQPENVSHVGQ